MDERGPRGRLQAVGGVDHAVDQVKRRIAFQGANPEWRIRIDEDDLWHGERDDGPGAVVMHTLKELLDALGAPKGGPA